MIKHEFRSFLGEKNSRNSGIFSSKAILDFFKA